MCSFQMDPSSSLIGLEMLKLKSNSHNVIETIAVFSRQTGEQNSPALTSVVIQPSPWGRMTVIFIISLPCIPQTLYLPLWTQQWSFWNYHAAWPSVSPRLFITPVWSPVHAKMIWAYIKHKPDVWHWVGMRKGGGGWRKETSTWRTWNENVIFFSLEGKV